MTGSPALSRRRERLAIRVFFACAFVVFTCVYPYLASVNNPNENVRTYMTMAIVEDHTFRIDHVVERYGWVNDMARAPDKAGEPHLYSVKAPATSYLGVPVYFAFAKLAPRLGVVRPEATSPPAVLARWLRLTTFALRLFCVQLPCFAFLLWLERWLRGTTSDAALRLAAVGATAFGTNYLAYSLMFTSHALFAVAAFASFGITTRELARHPADARRRRKGAAFLAGFYAGLATLLEYHALPVSFVLGLYAFSVFYRPTRLALLVLGAALHAGGLFFFQWRAFNDPFMPGHRMSENPAFAAILQQGYFGIGKPSLEVFGSISASRTFGFFATSPFMALGLLAVPWALLSTFGPRRERRVRRRATLAWLLTMLALWLTVSAAANWRGGWTVGPRYLGAAPPFFAYGAVCALERLAGTSVARRAFARAIAAGLAAAGAVHLGFVGLVYPSVPEAVARPFAGLALPLARAGFVPYHAAEWLGLTGVAFFFVVVGAMAVALAVPLFVPFGDRIGPWVARAVVGPVALAAGLTPALAPLPAEEGGDGLAERAWFVQVWEPAGRDRLTRLREEAERNGPRRPCVWHELAHVERALGFDAQALIDEGRGQAIPVARCARRHLWF